MKKLIIILTFLFSNIIIGQNDLSKISESFKNPNKNRLDSIARKLNFKGGETFKVMTIFTIDENGNIVDIKARSTHQAFEQEAIRVIKELPKMNPAILNGEKIRQKYSLPIVFKVETESERKSRERKEKRKKEKELRKRKL